VCDVPHHHGSIENFDHLTRLPIINTVTTVLRDSTYDFAALPSLLVEPSTRDVHLWMKCPWVRIGSVPSSIVHCTTSPVRRSGYERGVELSNHIMEWRTGGFGPRYPTKVANTAPTIGSKISNRNQESSSCVSRIDSERTPRTESKVCRDVRTKELVPTRSTAVRYRTPCGTGSSKAAATPW
jgi:hypothetical protein